MVDGDDWKEERYTESEEFLLCKHVRYFLNDRGRVLPAIN